MSLHVPLFLFQGRVTGCCCTMLLEQFLSQVCVRVFPLFHHAERMRVLECQYLGGRAAFVYGKAKRSWTGRCFPTPSTVQESAFTLELPANTLNLVLCLPDRVTGVTDHFVPPFLKLIPESDVARQHTDLVLSSDVSFVPPQSYNCCFISRNRQANSLKSYHQGLKVLARLTIL